MKISILFLIIISFFTFSCSEDNTGEVQTSGLVVDVPDGVPLTSLVSAKGESAWAFVRQSATWGDGNSSTMDAILVGLINSGLLSRSGTYTDDNVTVSNQSMTIRLTVDANTSISTASAFSGSKTFDHKFEMWRNSDDEKALELFFDSVDSLTTDGVLMYYKLKVLSPSEFNGDDVIVESYAFQSDSGPKQTYSWSGGNIVSGGTGEAGRVVIEEMSDEDLFCFKSVVKLDGTLDWCTGGNSEYYSLAYTQRLDGNGEVTAVFGYKDNAVDNDGELCAISNPLNYGTFNEDGFVADGVSSPGSSYPDTSRVDTLFSEVGTTGAGDWDDTSKTKIDGLNIQFNDTSAP